MWQPGARLVTEPEPNPKGGRSTEPGLNPKGGLSAELTNVCPARCVVVDPMPLRLGKKQVPDLDPHTEAPILAPTLNVKRKAPLIESGRITHIQADFI